MKYLSAALLAAGPFVLAAACAITGDDGSSSGQSSSSGTGGASASCVPCQTDAACGNGSQCATLGGATFCAPDCSPSGACAPDRVCTTVPGVSGGQVQVCVPITNVCGTGTSSGTTSSGSSSTSGATTTSSTTSTSSTSSSGSPGTVGPSGGTLAKLSFAVVGDTRPPTDNDSPGYPTPIITKIWQEVAAASPAFAIATGDFQYASPYKTNGTQAEQIGFYMGARAAFKGVLFPVMGNHECDGATAGNCDACGSACDTVGGKCVAGSCQTPNYTAFASAMLAPIAQSLPYYSIKIDSTTNAWTSKFVFVACNAWSPAQAAWLASQLAEPTTYTFVVRHEGSDATTAPCLSGTGSMNADTIMAGHPYTLLLAGHTHTFAYYPGQKQMIIGNGGAPLSGAVDYGYVIAEQQANGEITFNEYDYATNASQFTYSVGP